MRWKDSGMCFEEDMGEREGESKRLELFVSYNKGWSRTER